MAVVLVARLVAGILREEYLMRALETQSNDAGTYDCALLVHLYWQIAHTRSLWASTGCAPSATSAVVFDGGGATSAVPRNLVLTAEGRQSSATSSIQSACRVVCVHTNAATCVSQGMQRRRSRRWNEGASGRTHDSHIPHASMAKASSCGRTLRAR